MALMGLVELRDIASQHDGAGWSRSSAYTLRATKSRIAFRRHRPEIDNQIKPLTLLANFCTLSNNPIHSHWEVLRALSWTKISTHLRGPAPSHPLHRHIQLSRLSPAFLYLDSEGSGLCLPFLFRLSFALSRPGLDLLRQRCLAVGLRLKWNAMLRSLSQSLALRKNLSRATLVDSADSCVSIRLVPLAAHYAIRWGPLMCRSCNCL